MESRVAVVVAALALAFACARPGIPDTTISRSPAPPAGPTLSSARQSPTTASARARPTIPPGFRIQIPRVGIDLEIVEGDVGRDRFGTPDGFAFHFPGTALPGTQGNAFVYAHARPGMFLSLWGVRIGDTVAIVAPNGGTLRYAVEEVHRSVSPDDVSWLRQTADERLTLQTSTGPTEEDPRFLVIARRR